MTALTLLESLQSLLRESRYTTTYKFALLHALCDLSFELAPKETKLPLNRVAERVIELYWQQVVPFAPFNAQSTLSLRMSTGGPAAAVALVDRLHRQHSGRLTHVRQSGFMNRYSAEMLKLLKKDVLKRLQPVDAPPLLYRLPITRDSLELLPGVAEMFRRFNWLIIDMIQVRWTAWIERQNPEVSGSDALRQHLFVPDREALRTVVPALLDLQSGRCFYTSASLTRSTADVDHFLPWSITHNNSVGNLVLASKDVNRKKADQLASAAKCRAWQARNEEHANALQDIAQTTGLPWQPEALHQLSEWLYRRSA